MKYYKFGDGFKLGIPANIIRMPAESRLQLDAAYLQELMGIYRKAVCNYDRPLSMEKYYQYLGAMKLLQFLIVSDGCTLSGVRWMFSRTFQIGKKYDIRGNCVGEY